MHERRGLVYLDLPVGVRRDGFDVFTFPELFATGASVGAPPDPFFTSGQDWGFPPVIPDAQRAQGYEYLIASLRNHMRFSDQLRLDHVMAFYRLFIIPDGLDTKDGVYVHYPHEEAFAILSLESHGNRCRLVGENLGTVPPAVNTALTKHDMAPLYVAQYEVQPKASAALRPVTPRSVASANTHDMPPIATWWEGTDITDRINLGLFDPDLEQRETTQRHKLTHALTAYLQRQGLIGAAHDEDDELREVRDAIHAHLADSEADLMLINIEDLWLERHWQNVPGTHDTYPNWRHKLRFDLAQIREDPEIHRQLAMVNDLRRSHRQTPSPTD
jgi:4-alpha-glucanotransferase